MIPVDSDDIQKEYEVLLNELRQYNPDLLLTPRLLALTKSDLIDEELEQEIREEIKDLDPIFISAITQKGLPALKDELWQLLNLEDNEG